MHVVLICFLLILQIDSTSLGSPEKQNKQSVYNCERGWLRPTPACRGRLILRWLTAGCAVISLPLARKFQGGLGLEVVVLLQVGIQKNDLESDLHRCLQQKKDFAQKQRDSLSPTLCSTVALHLSEAATHFQGGFSSLSLLVCIPVFSGNILTDT